jgi:NADH dehydrogenase [ubiquinone] 1 alpha subcomplex assembly factor 5
MDCFAIAERAKPRATMVDEIRVFDRPALRRQRMRAAPGFAGFDFLVRAGAERLADRLDDIKGGFPRVLELGARGAVLREAIGARAGEATYVAADCTLPFAAAAHGLRVVADEEWLPFAGADFDLVISNLALHWTNDLPGALIQMRRCLKPDGLLLVSLLGGRTLMELRACLLDAELEIAGGASPRVSPFADMRDAGGLLQRAGLALPVVDADLLTVRYRDALALMRDLRGMGESNALSERRRAFTRRDVLLRAGALYAERFSGPDGRIAASFEIVTLTGWAPAESQPRPLKPGSASMRLAEALGTQERPAGDKAGRG